MSYRIRFTLPDGRTGLWNNDYPSREAAQRAIDDRLADTGFAYSVEEVPEPGSTAAHHVEILRERVNELEAELAKAKASLAKAPSVPVGASEAPREGGDSDRRRLEALERWLRVDTYRLVFFASHGVMVALSDSVGADDVEAPTLVALADKLMEKEAKP